MIQPFLTHTWWKTLPDVALGSLLLEARSPGSHVVIRGSLCAYGGERRISQRDPDMGSAPRLDEGLKFQCPMLHLYKEGSKSS